MFVLSFLLEYRINWCAQSGKFQLKSESIRKCWNFTKFGTISAGCRIEVWQLSLLSNMKLTINVWTLYFYGIPVVTLPKQRWKNHGKFAEWLITSLNYNYYNPLTKPQIPNVFYNDIPLISTHQKLSQLALLPSIKFTRSGFAAKVSK